MPTEGGVVVATLAAHTLPIEFMSSWGDMMQYDAVTKGYLLPPRGGAMKMTSGPRIAEARSQLVDMFFAEETFKGAEWLLMIDSDMVFGPNLVEQLMEHADPEKVPILGGLCFAGGRNHNPYPTIYREEEATSNGKPFTAIAPHHDYPRDALVRCGATGGACLMVHRQVFIAMSHPHPKGFGTQADGSKTPYPWFVEGLVAPNGEPIGEDIAFCRRATTLGIPIHVHTGIKLGHIKHFILDEGWYDASHSAHEALRAEPVDRTNVERAPAEERRAKARARLAGDDSDQILAGALG